MPSVAVLAADGFETIECLTMVDVMRRGGVRATLVSIMPTREVVSSLQIPVTCDALFDEINFDEYDCVVLPGGLPGATNLRADQRVCDVVCEFAARRRHLRRPVYPGRARPARGAPCHVLPWL